MQPRVFSGIQPSGASTIGNYLGAIRNWVRDQERFDNIFCVVDLHALTVPQDPASLRARTWELAAILLSCGIDPDRSLLFVQSHVSEHTSLCWLLNNVTPIGWLNRMTQFKSKAGAERDSVAAGLLDYPVLMAADILAYRAQYVPVGEDQKQHVELTRDVAARFNSLYGEILTVPEPLIPPVGARIMSLDDPSKKMSKSDPAGALFLLDDAATVRKKLSRAVTDSLGEVRFSDSQPGLLNLLTMIQILSGESTAEIERSFTGQGYRAVKERLGDLVIEAITPLQERYQAFQRQPETVDEVLKLGAERARSISGPVVREVEGAMGLRPPSTAVAVPGSVY